MMDVFKDARVLITGGTGSLGHALVYRLLKKHEPKKIIIFSRDEAKQHAMRVEYQHESAATDDLMYSNFKQMVEFRIGDVRDYRSIVQVLRDADIVFNTAAIKQVPVGEYFPFEAVRTNIGGAENIVSAICEHDLPVRTVIGISTDKACKPINAYGMTKALMERVFISANIRKPTTRFVLVRYGNVMGSTGSVLPLFREQIKNNHPLTITHKDMTRFMMNLDEAVNLIFSAANEAKPGEIYVPHIKSALMVDVANAMSAGKEVETEFTGIRPGEKIHELLISSEEITRTLTRNNELIILPQLPELRTTIPGRKVNWIKEYSSQDCIMSFKELQDILRKEGYL